MATAPQNPSLPPLYNELVPLSSQEHANYRIRQSNAALFMTTTHAIPLTIEELPLVQRRMPIVFTEGADPIPLGLMGLNEGVNVFFNDAGMIDEVDFYVPAYIRRYPYMLVRLNQGSEDLSLCFDPTADTIGAFDDGEPLFADGQPTELTQAILAFNEQFERAGHNTGLFMKELVELNILMDGEISIQPEGAPQPFVYRGFRMVDENKLKELRGDQLRKLAQNGMLPLIYAHIMSMNLMRDVFERQVRQNKVPGISFTPNAAPVAQDA